MKRGCVLSAKKIRINVLIFFATLIIYLINRFYMRTIVNYHSLLGGFVAFHLNDFLCGMFFLAGYSLALKREIEKLWECIILISICAICWEYITPFFKSNSYGDWKDVIAYIVGGGVYWVIIRLFGYEQKNISVLYRGVD